MEKKDLIEMTRIYIDTNGAGRLYIPKEFMAELGFRNKEKVLLSFGNGLLTVSAATREMLKR